MTTTVNSTLRQFCIGGVFIVTSLMSASAFTSTQQQAQEETTQTAKVVLASATVSKADPYEMVQTVASRTFARIKDQQGDIQQNPEILRDIMEQELMPYINYQFSAFKVLGKYTRTADRKEILEFVSVFRQYLITSYAVAMGYYDDQVVEFEPARSYDGRNDVTVRATIKDDERPDIKVAFKVRKDSKSNEWEAYDMIAEGISLLSSKQSEFEAIIRKDGIQGAIASMRSSIEQPIQLQSQQASVN